MVRRRDSADNTALYFLAVEPRMDGVADERGMSALDETDAGRLGVNGMARASLDVDGVIIDAQWLDLSYFLFL